MSVLSARFRSRIGTVLIGTALFMLALGLFPAQAQRSPEAEAAYEAARQAVAAATEAYAGGVSIIDQPLWRTASRLAAEAYRLAPEDPETILLLAELYTRVGWFIRAWPYWQDYLARSETLGEAATTFAEAGTQLGYSRYEAGDLPGALGYYEAVAAELPQDAEALSWLGRIHFEAGDPAAALPYWETLVALEPDNAGYRYYLELSRQAVVVGPEAGRAFQEGLAAYEAGDLAGARTAFERAFEAAARAGEDFALALEWAGRSSLELREPQAAEGYWRRVLELEPDNASARYFAELAAEQTRWGIEAATAFVEGQGLYAAGDLRAAAERFDDATVLNPDYEDAFAWAARAYQDLGEPERAARYWETLLARNPDDARARYFLELLELQVRYGSEAGLAFVEGVSAFELADLDAAQGRFEAAVAANPAFAEAWGWLGRVHFTAERYPEAASAYERALELAPDNDDYRFFAEEARALSP